MHPHLAKVKLCVKIAFGDNTNEQGRERHRFSCGGNYKGLKISVGITALRLKEKLSVKVK